VINIMIVEDDEILSKEIKTFLEKWGYEAMEVFDFQHILSGFSRAHPHLILMDVNLPYYDGFYWCRKIREISEVPIIYISSRDDVRDKIMAIAQGGDDYVEKPFHLELLKAKIEAIIRRTYQYKVKDRVYLNENLYFQHNTSSLIFQDKELELTKSERKILSKLMESKSEVVTREELMMELWSTDEYVSDTTLTTVICRLRNKLNSTCGDEIIKTRKGQGYYIE
jgi:DNA-binding response OmpR family regulator